MLSVIIPHTFSFAQNGLITQEAIQYFNEGVKAYKNGDLERASTCFQKTMIMDPRNNNYRAYALNNLGAIYMNQGYMDRAEEMFIEVLKIDPAYKPAQLNLGLIIEAKGDRVKALEFWAKVFDIDGRKPKAPVIEDQQKTDDPALVSGKAEIKK
jgi:tetratricopeptide (TPR) repeat protein